MSKQMPGVVSATELDNGGFLGEPMQVGIVTEDLKRAMDELIQLGIGPWMLLTVGPENAEMHYRGERTGFSMRVGFATHGEMMWELLQPLEGESIYTEFLAAGRQGLHHIGIECKIPFEERAAEFERRGYTEIQGGVAFDGNVPFGYFESDEPDSTLLEIFEFPEGFEPEPEEWYPAPPPA